VAGFTAAQLQSLRIVGFQSANRVHRRVLCVRRQPCVGQPQGPRLAGFGAIELQGRSWSRCWVRIVSSTIASGTSSLLLMARRLAEAVAGGGMHRVDYQPRIGRERMDDSALAALQRESHRASIEAFVELFQPSVEGFGVAGIVPASIGLSPTCAGESVFSLAPVQSHQGRIVFGIHCVFGMAGPGLQIVCVRRG